MMKLGNRPVKDGAVVVLSIKGSNESCHSKFAFAGLRVKKKRMVLGGLERATVADEAGDRRLVDFYYDIVREKVAPAEVLRLVEKWREKWLAYGIRNGVRVSVDESLEKVVKWLEAGTADFPP